MSDPTDGIRFEIRVKPKARAERVGGTWGEAGALVVEVQAAAVDGRANAAVVAALAAAFEVPRRQVRIVTGERSRTKLVAVAGDPTALAVRLTGLVDGGPASGPTGGAR